MKVFGAAGMGCMHLWCRLRWWQPLDVAWDGWELSRCTAEISEFVDALQMVEAVEMPSWARRLNLLTLLRWLNLLRCSWFWAIDSILLWLKWFVPVQTVAVFKCSSWDDRCFVESSPDGFECGCCGSDGWSYRSSLRPLKLPRKVWEDWSLLCCCSKKLRLKPWGGWNGSSSWSLRR